MAIETDWFTCPYCWKRVPARFEINEDGTNNGFISDPDTVLVADWVYHAKCWDEQLERSPP